MGPSHQVAKLPLVIKNEEFASSLHKANYLTQMVPPITR